MTCLWAGSENGIKPVPVRCARRRDIKAKGRTRGDISQLKDKCSPSNEGGSQSLI